MRWHRLRRWRAVGLYAVALACLLLIGWATRQQLQCPEVRTAWACLTRAWKGVDSVGLNSVRLHPGKGQLVDGIITLGEGKRPLCDTVSLAVEDGGENWQAAVRLVQPFLSLLLLRLGPLLLALVFWGLGVIVLAFSALGKRQILFFLFCQVSGAVLAADAASAGSSVWTGRSYGFLLWWLGPLAVHFHFYFPKPVSLRRTTRLMIFVYTVAILGGLLDWAVGSRVLHTDLTLLYTIRHLWLILGLLGVVFLLARAHRGMVSSKTRRRIGFVALGAGMALAFFISLSMLPGILLHRPVVPDGLSFLFPLIVPLAYGYALLRDRLVWLERYVRHSAAYALAVVLLGGLYLVVRAILIHLFPPDLWRRAAPNLAMALLLAVLFGPLCRRLHVIINRLLYGGWYDYRSAVQQISQMLDRAGDCATLAETLSQGMQKAMQLECACLLLPDMGESLACQSCAAHRWCRRCLDNKGALGQYFQSQPKVIEVAVLREALAGSKLSEEEAQLLACRRARLWIPLRGREHYRGILILGAKCSGEPFDAGDLEILEVVIRQAGIALENAHLVNELQQRALESERLHRQALRAREEERKRVARELHDQIIQALVGLNYQLSDVRSRLSSEGNGHISQMQDQVRYILSDVRRICAGLRPPALDSLGLVPAARSRLREMSDQAPFEIMMSIEGDDGCDLPEEVALCIYRVLQEALLNVQKHAGARRVTVRLRIGQTEVSLSVEDDGKGFQVPKRLGQLTDDGHFGLVGLRERLELVNGTLEVVSIPGQGCRLEAQVPVSLGWQMPHDRSTVHVSALGDRKGIRDGDKSGGG